MDLLLETNAASAYYGDIALTNGAAEMVSSSDDLAGIVGQRIRLSLLTCKNEWFLDSDFGYDYLRCLTKGADVYTSALEAQDIVSEIEGVKRVESFSINEVREREYEFSYRVQIDDGTTITGTV